MKWGHGILLLSPLTWAVWVRRKLPVLPPAELQNSNDDSYSSVRYSALNIQIFFCFFVFFCIPQLYLCDEMHVCTD